LADIEEKPKTARDARRDLPSGSVFPPTGRGDRFHKRFFQRGLVPTRRMVTVAQNLRRRVTTERPLQVAVSESGMAGLKQSIGNLETAP